MAEKQIRYLVSACLAGEKCRYDCQAKLREPIRQLVQQGEALAVCPEQLGDLPTPRPPAEKQSDGRVLTVDGHDVSDNYQKGAKEALALLEEYPIEKAFLKSKSPMCGSSKIYDGTFSGSLTSGDGVFTELLKKAKISIKEID